MTNKHNWKCGKHSNSMWNDLALIELNSIEHRPLLTIMSVLTVTIGIIVANKICSTEKKNEKCKYFLICIDLLKNVHFPYEEVRRFNVISLKKVFKVARKTLDIYSCTHRVLRKLLSNLHIMCRVLQICFVSLFVSFWVEKMSTRCQENFNFRVILWDYGGIVQNFNISVSEEEIEKCKNRATLWYVGVFFWIVWVKKKQETSRDF